MNRELPPIAKLAMRVLACVEEAVTRFPRKHRYTLGSDLRSRAMAVARATHRAWRDQARRQQRVHELALAIDDLKITLQLGKDVQAFRSFGQFEAVARLVNDLGRQCGGWLKQMRSQGQNAAGQSPSQRAPILSSRAALQGASP
jgi:hypothetical protein